MYVLCVFIYLFLCKRSIRKADDPNDGRGGAGDVGGDDDGGVGGVRRTPMRFIQLYTSPSFRNQRSKLVTPSSDWEQSKGDVSKHKFSPLVGVHPSNVVTCFMPGEWQGYEFVRSRDACCGGYIYFIWGKSLEGGGGGRQCLCGRAELFCRCVPLRSYWQRYQPL